MFQAQVRVIYGDTDQMGVVYYANYLRYFELARSELLRAHGKSYREMEAEGFSLPVVEATCRYLAPERYEDLLLVGVDTLAAWTLRVDGYQLGVQIVNVGAIMALVGVAVGAALAGLGWWRSRGTDASGA